jgi:hypothetical protein
VEALGSPLILGGQPNYVTFYQDPPATQLMAAQQRKRIRRENPPPDWVSIAVPRSTIRASLIAVSVAVSVPGTSRTLIFWSPDGGLPSKLRWNIAAFREVFPDADVRSCSIFSRCNELLILFLGAGTLTPVAGAFAYTTSFPNVDLIAGETYFVGFQNVQGLLVNFKHEGPSR